MKHLYLVRHATAISESAGNDYDRSLSDKGKKEAPLIAEKLNVEQSLPDLIIASPALRTISTTKLLVESLQHPVTKVEENTLIYNGALDNVLAVIHQIDDLYSQVVIVGHNPGISDAANYLASENIGYFCPSSIVGLQFDVHAWLDIEQGQGKLLFSDISERDVSCV